MKCFIKLVLIFLFTVNIFCAHAQTRYLKINADFDTPSHQFFKGEILIDAGDGDNSGQYVLFAEEKIYLDESNYTRLDKQGDTKLNQEQLLIEKGSTRVNDYISTALKKHHINGKPHLTFDNRQFKNTNADVTLTLADQKEIIDTLTLGDFATISWSKIPDTLRIIPSGYPSLFIKKVEIVDSGNINDTTRFDLIDEYRDVGYIFLRKKGTQEYHFSDSTFRPGNRIQHYQWSEEDTILEINKGELILRNPNLGDYLKKLSPEYWFLIALIIVLLFGGGIYFFIERAKKSRYIRHIIRQNDTLDKLILYYNNSYSENIKLGQIISNNKKLLKRFKIEENQFDNFSRFARPLVGKELIIPIQITNQPKDNEGISESAKDKLSHAKNVDFTQKNHDHKDDNSIFRSLEELKNSIKELRKEQRDGFEKASTSGDQKIKNDLNKAQKSVDEYRHQLDTSNDKFKNLKSQYDNTKKELERMTEVSSKYKNNVNVLKSKALFFSEKESRPFAQNRITVLNKSLESWDRLYDLFVSSQQMSKAKEESDSLSMILFKDKYTNIHEASINCKVKLISLYESGIWTNADHVRKLRSEKDEGSSLNFINKDIYKQVFEPMLSTVLVMLEEAKNLEKLLNRKSDIINRAVELGASASDIRNTSYQLMGIEIDYVPLFESIQNYHAMTSAVSNQPNPLFDNVSISRDHIIQILSYGMEYQGEKSKTKVILKSK